jgi:hypothetical protein
MTNYSPTSGPPSDGQTLSDGDKLLVFSISRASGAVVNSGAVAVTMRDTVEDATDSHSKTFPPWWPRGDDSRQPRAKAFDPSRGPWFVRVMITAPRIRYRDFRWAETISTILQS